MAINPLAVATIQRLPQRTIESMRPTPGTVSPRVTVQTPSGPSRIAVPPRTSRTVQPSIVVGLVSGTGPIVSRGATDAPGGFVFACTTEAVREPGVAPASAIPAGRHQDNVSTATGQVPWVDACRLRRVLTQLANGRILYRLNLSRGSLLVLHDRTLLRLPNDHAWS